MENLPYTKVTLGIAAYNGGASIQKTLDSLVAQTFNDLKIVICDDCSNDNTVIICEKYQNNFKNIFIIKNPKNIRMYKNLNKVFQFSNSAYFAWVDQDDYREKDFVKKCNDILDSDQGAVMAQCQVGVISKVDNKLMHINSITSVVNEFKNVAKYRNLIKHYLDTHIYGLIRSKPLNETSLWQDINGSSYCLTFELLLKGKFLDVPGLLSYYHGMGLSNRPTPKEEMARSSKKKSLLDNFPALAIAFFQTKIIINSSIKFFEKFIIIYLIFLDLFCNYFLKFFYRFFSKISFGILDNYLFKICNRFYNKEKDSTFLVDKKKYLHFYPLHYPFKKLTKNTSALTHQS
jgi:glycosyltransferase involved in cell wall biosynthesis|tara:strand:- start:303 stop:1340 length:1038 start_codon:yes stop_codon:yes gene_type:complete